MTPFSYVIEHIPGEENHWDDLLSRWRVLGSETPVVRANPITVVIPAMDDYFILSKDEIQNMQVTIAYYPV